MHDVVHDQPICKIYAIRGILFQSRSIFLKISSHFTQTVYPLFYNFYQLIFIEFARDSYIRALSNFSSRVIGAAVIIYIECSFDICWERILKRHKAAVAEGTDDHYIAREEMEKSYLRDDVEDLRKQFRDITVVVNNEKEGEQFIDDLAEDVLRIIRSRS